MHEIHLPGGTILFEPYDRIIRKYLCTALSDTDEEIEEKIDRRRFESREEEKADSLQDKAYHYEPAGIYPLDKEP